MSEPVVYPLYASRDNVGSQMGMMAMQMSDQQYCLFLFYETNGIILFDTTNGFNAEVLDENGDYHFNFQDSDFEYTDAENVIDGYWNSDVIFNKEIVTDTIGQVVNSKLKPLVLDEGTKVVQHEITMHVYDASTPVGLYITIYDDNINDLEASDISQFLVDNGFTYQTGQGYLANGSFSRDHQNTIIPLTEIMADEYSDVIYFKGATQAYYENFSR